MVGFGGGFDKAGDRGERIGWIGVNGRYRSWPGLLIFGKMFVERGEKEDQEDKTVLAAIIGEREGWKARIMTVAVSNVRRAQQLDRNGILIASEGFLNNLQ